MNPIIQPPRPQSPVEEIHFSHYIQVILRRLKTFGFTFLAVFVAIAVYTFTMTPVYEASATLNIKDDKAKTGVLADLSMLASNNPIDAEMEIIKSRTNSERVVQQLHLNWQITDRSSGMGCKLLEFDSTSTRPQYRLEITGPGSYRLQDAEGNTIGSGKTGQLLKAKEVSLVVGELAGRTGDHLEMRLQPAGATAEALQKAIRVSEVGKKTNIIRIAYSNSDPRLARNVVNALVQAYLEQNVAFKAEEASRTVSFVEDQLKGVRQELDKAETDLQGYKSSAGMVKLDAEAEELIKKFSDTEKERAGVNLQKKQVDFALGSLKEASRKGIGYSPAVSADPLVAGMASRLSELEVQRRALLAEYTAEHPLVKGLQSQIDELQHKIQSTYETARSNLARQEMDISGKLASYEGALKQLPAAERDLARYMRVAKVNADIYTFLLQKHEEAKIAQASTISNIKVVDPAIDPTTPIKPRKGKNLLLGFLVALMLGIGLAFFHDYMDDAIKDGEEAKRLLNWPLLTVIPHIPVLPDGQDRDVKLISHLSPKSPAAEAFRSLRTALHYSAVQMKHKVIMVTSSFPGEGKSTTAANMAEIFSQAGAKVLLMGCDLRRPTLKDLLGFEQVPGLTEVLSGRCSLGNAVHRTGIKNLDYLSSGHTPPNPAEFLASNRMAQLVDHLRTLYDYIILDAPPVLALSDVPILTPRCDAVVVVLEVGKVPAKAAMRTSEILASVDAPIAGIVMNDKTGRAEAYGYGYYGYSYGYEEDRGTDRNWWKRFLPSAKAKARIAE